MSSRLKLAGICFAAAFGLAACGGGGGGTATTGSTPGPTPPPAKTALSYATDLNDSVATLTTLSAAATEDGSALMMAMKYSAMIGTEASDGDSMAAAANAQKVLDAKTMLMEAIDDATAAKTAAEEAKADTEDADVIAALDSAIMAAETQIEAAEGVLKGDDLAGYVEMVTGDDADDLKTAADRGEEVAMAVAMALGPTVTGTGANGAGLRVTHGQTAPAATVKDANKLETDDHQGMTWMEVTGASMKMRIASAADDTNEVYVSSVADMVLASTQTATAADGTENDGVQYGATYKGIPGTAICVGTDCKVETVDDVGTSGQPGFVDNSGNRKFAGSWYFTPTYPKAYYKKGTDGTYSLEEYAQFGHWLVVAANGEVTVNTYAVRVALDAVGGTASTATGTWDSPTPGDANLGASSATYSGMAAGRSVHKTLDDDGDVTDIQSGRFMADVKLTATFAGAGSTLGGAINNFRGVDNPDAVDSSWEVTLNAFTTSDGSVAANVPGTPGGVAEATGQDGTWSAAAYGEAGMRPAGIYGGFNAHFTDGHAAGAYATRKDK